MKAIYLVKTHTPIVYGKNELVEKYFDEFFINEDYKIDEISSFNLGRYGAELEKEDRLIKYRLPTGKEIIAPVSEIRQLEKGIVTLESIQYVKAV